MADTSRLDSERLLISRFARALLGVAVATLILAAGASSRSAAADLVVPTLLQPAAGQNIAVGTPIVFQIQTHAGDDYLWL